MSPFFLVPRKRISILCVAVVQTLLLSRAVADDTDPGPCVAPVPPPAARMVPRIQVSAPTTKQTAQPAVFAVNRRIGALSGKTIYLSPGHGYLDKGTSWATQRPNCFGLCEDYEDIEMCAFYLAQYCYNAGAFMVSTREIDTNPNMVIVDNEVASTPEGAFTSSGFTMEPSETIDDHCGYSYSGLTAYPLTGNTRAFVGVDHSCLAAGTSTASATWTANIPEDGLYSVYLSFGHKRLFDEDPDPAYVTDAHYTVRHGGGATEFRVNQQLHQCTWVFLGRFYFYKGQNPEKGSVTLDNESAASIGLKVSADAVRFGGGMGNVARYSSVSGLRRYEESAKYYAQFGGGLRYTFHGSDSDTELNNEISAYWYWPVELHQGNGEDAVTIQIHTNASGTPGSGTGTATWTNPTHTNSHLLQEKIHTEIINDIRKAYYPSWTSRAYRYWTGDYYTQPPTVTVELAFHDREFPDNTFLKDPKFRQLTMRAVYQGIVKYFAAKDGTTPFLLPEPPRAPSVRNTPTGIRLAWLAPETDLDGVVGDAADSYRVYLSRDGHAWDGGRDVVDTEYTTTGLTLNRVYYFRVTAVNSGGESFPTKTLAARVAGPKPTRILIVDGYDRLDRGCLIERTGMPSVGTIYTMELDKMNAYNYVIPHARSVDFCNEPFDSADCSAVALDEIALTDYVFVDWILGRQGERIPDDNTVDSTFDTSLRAKVEAFLGKKCALFLSGTDIGFDLDSNSDQADPESVFLNSVLMADYSSDDANSYQFKGADGSIFEGIGPFQVDDGTGGSYDADAPDVLAPVGGSFPCMTDASGAACTGVQYSGGSRVVFLAFPFETITAESTRNEIMQRILQSAVLPYTEAASPWQWYE